MRKLFNLLTLVIVLATFIACSSNYKGYNDDKKILNGTWTVTDVKYEDKLGLINIKPLGEQDVTCLKNSTWSFVANNNSGNYFLPATCESLEREIKWDLTNNGGGLFFQYKRIYDEFVPKSERKKGYLFKVISFSDTQMIFRSSVVFSGKPYTIDYYFTKK